MSNFKIQSSEPNYLYSQENSRLNCKGERGINGTASEGRECIGCGQWKPFFDFHRKGSRQDARCKECISARKKETYRRKKILIKQKATAKRRVIGPTIVGDITSPTLDNFTTIFAQGIKDLINEGKL